MFTNQFVFQLNLGKMYSWNFDVNPFKEESLQCSLRGNKHQIFASTRNKLFILGQQDSPGILDEKDFKFGILIKITAVNFDF